MDTGSPDLRRTLRGSRGARPGSLLALERALWIAGALGLGWCAFVITVSRIDDALASRRLDAAIAARRSTPFPPVSSAPGKPSADLGSSPLPPLEVPEVFGPTAPPVTGSRETSISRRVPAARPLARGAIVARLEIERLGLSVVAREGDDSRTLRFAVGHVPGTPVPPAEGNAVFAGHRDRQFRGLGRLKPDDTIRLTTEAGDFVYRVEWTAVVDPNASWVMDPTPDPAITLVTCFPFGYVGNAPDRFIVRARRASR